MQSPKYVYSSTSPTLPKDAKQTTVSQQQTDFFWCHGSKPLLYQPPLPLLVQDYIHANNHWAIRSLNCPGNGVMLAQALIQGTAIAICNESYKDQFGTAGFVLQNGFSRESRIVGANVTPGHPNNQNPYRSKIGGMAAIIIVVKSLTLLYDIQSGTIKLGCDCASGLTAIFEHKYDTPSQPHHDMIHDIRKKLASSPITWQFQHVRGHQDKHIQFQHLDMWSQLNVEMDSLTKPSPQYCHSTRGTILDGACGYKIVNFLIGIGPHFTTMQCHTTYLTIGATNARFQVT